MMKRVDIQKDETTVNKNVENFSAEKKIERVKKEMSRMQSNNEQKENEVQKL